MNYYSDEKEWSWLFAHALDWDKIIPLYNNDPGLSAAEYRASLEELLTATGEWAANSLAARAERLDREGAGKVHQGRTYPSPPLEELYREGREMGVLAPTLPAEMGGLGLPACVSLLMLEQASRGCLASSTQLGFFSSIAEMIHRFCDRETAERLVPRIANGEISGAMALTEPGCGSDLSLLTSQAIAQGDGTFLLSGTKIFITNGGGGLNLALARVKGEDNGPLDLSLFLVEQDEITRPGALNYMVTKNEHKLGMHGSFTCEVVYESSVARLVGRQGEGLKQMFHLMNEARLATAFQALGVSEAALSYVHQYAQEREAFGKKLLDLPLFARNLDDAQTQVDALRALLVDTLSHYDIFQRLDLKKRHTGELSKKEAALFAEARLWSRKRTPLCKWQATELCTHLTQRAIQMLGGHGYMVDHPVERFHRDSFAPLLYEGTSQIQALTALKDVVKYAMQDPQRFFANIFFGHPARGYVNREKSTQREFTKERYRFKKRLVALLVKALRPEASRLWDPKAWMQSQNIERMLIHAETVTEAMAVMETLRVLAEHAAKDASRGPLFERYLHLSLPRLEHIYKDWELRGAKER